MIVSQGKNRSGGDVTRDPKLPTLTGNKFCLLPWQILWEK